MRWFVRIGICLWLLASPIQAAVVINEFLPAPSPGSKEWVEFYNYNSDTTTTDLSDYFFDDDTDFQSDTGSSAKIAIAGLLAPTSTCYWELSTYLNNNGDTPTLFNTAGMVIDSYAYTKTTTDKSYARVPDGSDWQADQAPTKAAVSCLDLAPTPTPTPTPTATSTASPTPKLTPTPTPTIKASASPQILAASTASTSATLLSLVTPLATPSAQTQKPTLIVPFLVAGGGLLLGLSLLPVMRKWYHKQSWFNPNSSTAGDQSSSGPA